MRHNATTRQRHGGFCFCCVKDLAISAVDDQEIAQALSTLGRTTRGVGSADGLGVHRYCCFRELSAWSYKKVLHGDDWWIQGASEKKSEKHRSQDASRRASAGISEEEATR